MRLFFRAAIHRVRQHAAQFAVLFVLAPCALRAETVPFSRAVQAALSHTGTMAVAAAEEAHARASLRQAKYMFLPQATIGAGLGASFGFPLTLEGSAPSLLNFNSQQFLLNFAQLDFIRAARLDWRAASQSTLDKRDQVVLDTALAYFELDLQLSKMKALRLQEESAHRAQFITEQRVQEGVDSQMDLTRAKLNAARVRMRIADTQAAIDVLRERLSKLTGLPAASIETDPESLPLFPEVNQADDIATRAAESSPAVLMAQQRAESAKLRARGERRQLLPAIDFASQYALLARFNNYDEFYRKFQRHNASIGINIRVPIFNAAQRAAADAADADAIKAGKAVDSARNQVIENTLKIQRSLAQLSAAAEVSRLEYELAQSGIDAANARMESGSATARDVENARFDAQDRYSSFLDMQLELHKAQLQLLRITNDIYAWSITKK